MFHILSSSIFLHYFNFLESNPNLATPPPRENEQEATIYNRAPTPIGQDDLCPPQVLCAPCSEQTKDFKCKEGFFLYELLGHRELEVKPLGNVSNKGLPNRTLGMSGYMSNKGLPYKL